MYELFSQDDKDGYENALRNWVQVNHQLFSDNDTVLVPPRLPEILFSYFFSAIDVSRKDIPIDNFLQNFDFGLSHTGNIGVGIKTFCIPSTTKNPKVSGQKIAEFDKQKHLFVNMNLKDKIIFISELWNDRIDKITFEYGIHVFKYHCVVRKGLNISIYEFPMCKIDIANIQPGKRKLFSDGNAEYDMASIDSKSTLKRRFEVGNSSCLINKFDIKINDMFSKKDVIELYSN